MCIFESFVDFVGWTRRLSKLIFPLIHFKFPNLISNWRRVVGWIAYSARDLLTARRGFDSDPSSINNNFAELHLVTLIHKMHTQFTELLRQ